MNKVLHFSRSCTSASQPRTSFCFLSLTFINIQTFIIKCNTEAGAELLDLYRYKFLARSLRKLSEVSFLLSPTLSFRLYVA
jgi:hypothetical protein